MQRTEAPLYRLAGVSPDQSMGWARYALALLAFNALGFLVLYLLQRWQAVLPLNPAGMAAVTMDSSFNTAISFVTNTNWQGYGGETTMSYLTQMLGLAAVSYTHLDVYKRQIQRRPSHSCNPLLPQIIV